MSILDRVPLTGIDAIDFRAPHSSSLFGGCELLPHAYKANQFVVLERTDIIAHCMVRKMNQDRLISHGQSVTIFRIIVNYLDRKLAEKYRTTGVRFGYVYNQTTDDIELRYGNGNPEPKILASNVKGLVLAIGGYQWAIDDIGEIIAKRTV